MGRFFTCAYLKPKDETGSPLQERLAAKLLHEGFEPSEVPADRWLALLSTKGSPWCFLLDSDTALDAPNAPDLRKAARKMAKATDCDVVCAEVVDSDAMAVLFCGGGVEDIVVCGLADGYDKSLCVTPCCPALMKFRMVRLSLPCWCQNTGACCKEFLCCFDYKEWPNRRVRI